MSYPIRRIWGMPNPATFTIKPIKELLACYVINPDRWLDPFAGYNSPVKWSNDLNPDTPTLYHMDAVEFVMQFKNGELFDGALLDPPYSLHQTNQVYKGYGLRKPISLVKDLIVSLVKPYGIVISFGFNSGGMGLKRGFEIIEILLVPHGGSHNDTIVVVERNSNPLS
jgi:hypothetical protein